VIDPGPAICGHLAAILAALGPGQRIAADLSSPMPTWTIPRWPRLSAAATGAPVLAFGTATDGRSPLMQAWPPRGCHRGGEGIDLPFAPIAPGRWRPRSRPRLDG
jgi:hypothetical protein